MDNCLGGASTTFHMLNEESRKYFTRALVMSGSVYSYFALTEGNHREKMKNCAHTDDVIEYLRDSDSRDIIQCHYADDWGKTLKPEWVPTIEAPGTLKSFITESPDVIWKSDTAPVLDALFSFTNEVGTYE